MQADITHAAWRTACTCRVRALAAGLAALVLVAAVLAPPAARAGEITAAFARSAPGANGRVDHSAWTRLIRAYVKPDGEGLNRVDYAAFKKGGHKALKAYIAMLENVDPTRLERKEQFAYWVNLYNAKTVDIILEHYPVSSIRKIRLTSFFFPGPWRKKVVRVNGIALSLDNIEHDILRAIFRDARIHYAVNCASIGCPNLALEAYTGARLETMLEAGARDYINSVRGVTVHGTRATASKIYTWFQEDFGGSEKAVLAHLRRYASPELKRRLAKVKSISAYVYDWALNDVRR